MGTRLLGLLTILAIGCGETDEPLPMTPEPDAAPLPNGAPDAGTAPEPHLDPSVLDLRLLTPGLNLAGTTTVTLYQRTSDLTVEGRAKGRGVKVYVNQMEIPVVGDDFEYHFASAGNGCGTSPDVLHFTAKDETGAEVGPLTVAIWYDTCAPTFTPVESTVEDERGYSTSLKYVDLTEGRYQPCLYHDASETKVALRAGEASVPDVWKFQINHRKGGTTALPDYIDACSAPYHPGYGPPADQTPSDGNPVRLRLETSDNAPGPYHVVVRGRKPDGSEFDVATLALGSDEASTFLLDQALFENAQGTLGLETTPGVWEMWAVATDRAGNSGTSPRMRWRNRLVPGPVFVEAAYHLSLIHI